MSNGMVILQGEKYNIHIEYKSKPLEADARNGGDVILPHNPSPEVF
jgi:hypothetical protein